LVSSSAPDPKLILVKEVSITHPGKAKTTKRNKLRISCDRYSFWRAGWRLLLLEFFSSSYGFKKKYGFFSDKTVRMF
jgi:hypothetical protein